MMYRVRHFFSAMHELSRFEAERGVTRAAAERCRPPDVVRVAEKKCQTPYDGSAGVLALQGSFEPHVRAFARLGIAAREVRRPQDLDGLTHLVLPGGESTTLHRLLELFELAAPILARHRAGSLALFGTCAGAILLGRPAPGDSPDPPRWSLLDAELRRNAYGRQIDSFQAALDVHDLDEDAPPRRMTGVFIRAPRIESLGPDVRVLARRNGEPVLVQAAGLLAATFHPELTDDPWLHALFLRRELWQRPRPSTRRTRSTRRVR